MANNLSTLSDEALMQAAGVSSPHANMSDADLAKIAGVSLQPKVGTDFKHHMLREEVIKNQGAPTLTKTPTLTNRIADEVGGVSEFIGNTVGTAGMLPVDAGHFMGSAVDSITQGDLSRENFSQNMARRAESTQGLRDALVMKPTTNRGKAMVQARDEGLAALGNAAHAGVMAWGRLGGYDDKVSEQFAGPASIAADLIPFILAERGISGLKTPKVQGEVTPGKAVTDYELWKQGINPKIAQGDIMAQHGRVMDSLNTRSIEQSKEAVQPKPEIQPDLFSNQSIPKPNLESQTLTNGDAKTALDTTVVKQPYKLEAPKSTEEMAKQQTLPLKPLYEAAVEAKSSGMDYPTFAKKVADTGVDINNLLGQLNIIGHKGLKDFFEEGVPLKNVDGSYQPLYDKVLNKLREPVKEITTSKITEPKQSAFDWNSGDTGKAVTEVSLPKEYTATPSLASNGEFLGHIEIQHNGKNVGHVSADFDHSTGEVHIVKSDISPEHQGKGLAQAIYKQLNDTLVKQGQQTLKSDSRNMTQAAIHLWESLVRKGLARERLDGTPGYEFINKQEKVGDINGESKTNAKGQDAQGNAYEEGQGLLEKEPFKPVEPEGTTQTELPLEDIGYRPNPVEVTVGGGNKVTVNPELSHGDVYKVTELQKELATERPDVEVGKNAEIVQVKDRGAGIATEDGKIYFTDGSAMDMPAGGKEIMRDRGVASNEPIPTPSQENQTSQSSRIASETPTESRSLTPKNPDSTSEGLDSPPENNTVDVNMGINPVKAADSFIDAAKDTFTENTSYAERNIFRRILNPQFMAESSKTVKALYDLFGLRRESRNAILYDLFKVGIEKGLKVYKDMSRDERKDFNELVNQSDRLKIAFPGDILRTDAHIFERPFSEKVIEAYELFQKQRIENVKREALERRELGLSQFEDRPWYDDLRGILVDKDVDGNPRIDLTEFFQQLKDNNLTLDSKLDINIFPDYLVEKGLAFNGQFIRDLAKAKERIDKINEVEQNYLDNPFYATRNREFGDWTVKAYQVVNGVVREDLPVFSAMAKTPKKAKQLKAAVMANPDKYFPINYNRMLKHDGRVDIHVADPIETPKLDEEMYLHAGRPGASVAKIQEALERAKAQGKIDPQIYDDIFEGVMESYQDITAMRGYARSNIHRNERLIEGYDTGDYFQTLKDHTSAMAGSLSKAKFMMEALKLMPETPREFKPLIQEMITNAVRNRDSQLEGISSTYRSAITLAHLGLRTTSILANMTQNMSMGAAEMNMRLRRDFNLKSTADFDIPKAQFDIMRGHYTPEEAAFLDWFERSGADQAQFVNEISGRGEKSASGLVNTVTGKALWAFGKIESKFNREALGLAMYRRLTKEGVDAKRAAEAAKETSNIAHGDMSPENLPLAAQGAAMELFSRPALALRRYNMHMVNYIFSRAMQKEFRPIARVLVVQTALGGAKAIPLFGAVNEVVERLTGKSLLMSIKKAVHTTMKEQDLSMAQVIDNVAERGLPSLVGIDLSNSLTLDIPFLFEEGDNTLGENLSGVGGSDITNVFKGIQKMRGGQPIEGALQAQPFAVVKDVGKAILGYKEGFKDKNGELLVDSQGNIIKLTGKEAALQALGITAPRIGNIRDMRSSEWRLSQFKNNRTSLYNTQLKNADNNGDTKRYDEVIRNRTQFLEDFDKRYPGLSSGNTRYRQPRVNRNLQRNLDFEQGISD